VVRKTSAGITPGGLQSVIGEGPGALAETAMDEKTWERNGGDLVGHFASTAGSTGMQSMANGMVSSRVDSKIGERSSIGGTIAKETASGLAGDTAGYMADTKNYQDAGQFWNGLATNTAESLKNNGVNAVGNAKARKYKAAAEMARDPDAAANWTHLSPEEKTWVESNLPAYKQRVDDGKGTSMLEMALSGKGADTPVETDPTKAKPQDTDNAPVDDKVLEEAALQDAAIEEAAAEAKTEETSDKAAEEEAPKTGNAEYVDEKSSFHGSHDKHNANEANISSHLRGLTDYVQNITVDGGGTVAKVKIPGTEALVDVRIRMGDTATAAAKGVTHAASFIRNADAS